MNIRKLKKCLPWQVPIYTIGCYLAWFLLSYMMGGTSEYITLFGLIIASTIFIIPIVIGVYGYKKIVV